MSDNPEPLESKVTLWGYEMSTRGVIAFMSVASLCGLTFMYPENFGTAFESISVAIVAFYFGQNSKKP